MGRRRPIIPIWNHLQTVLTICPIKTALTRETISMTVHTEMLKRKVTNFLKPWGISFSDISDITYMHKITLNLNIYFNLK